MEPCANKSARHDKKKILTSQKLQSTLADIRELIIKILQAKKANTQQLLRTVPFWHWGGLLFTLLTVSTTTSCWRLRSLRGRAYVCPTTDITLHNYTTYNTFGEAQNHTSQNFLTIICSSTRWQHVDSHRRRQSDIVAALHRAATRWRKPMDKTILASALHIVRVSTRWRSCPTVDGVAILRWDLTCRSTRWRQHQGIYDDCLLGKGASGCRTKLIVALSRADDNSG